MRLKLVPSETKIDFLKLRLSALGFSGLLVAASIARFCSATAALLLHLAAASRSSATSGSSAPATAITSFFPHKAQMLLNDPAGCWL